MGSEDQDILAKISQLAGQINRHKNGQPSDQNPAARPSAGTSTYQSMDAYQKNQGIANPYKGQPQSNATYWPSRGSYSTRGYSRGGRVSKTHRHRTLVLNGSNSTDTSSNNDDSTDTAKPSASGSAWVSKTDRHMQLINTSVFKKDSQMRVRAIEETRKQKLKQRDERERNRFNKHLQRITGGSHTPGQPFESATNHEITVQGIKFRVAKNGSKLVKVPGELSRRITGYYDKRHTGWRPCLPNLGDTNAAKSTPKTAIVCGVKFHRSTNGNMYRSGIIKAYRKNVAVKKINEPCKVFTTTGSCTKGPRCRYVHDPSKVAVCKVFLQKGSCPSGDSCDLSHDLTPERTPTCLHFAKGNCANANCRYPHVRVSPSAPVCRQFGIYGFCDKGLTCQDRHVYECPDFSNTGICTTKGCKLTHRHKASVMRNNATLGESTTDLENSDISSDDEDEEIDSEDVDSDDLEGEFLGDDGKSDVEIPTQKDYVHF